MCHRMFCGDFLLFSSKNFYVFAQKLLMLQWTAHLLARKHFVLVCAQQLRCVTIPPCNGFKEPYILSELRKNSDFWSTIPYTANNFEKLTVVQKVKKKSKNHNLGTHFVGDALLKSLSLQIRGFLVGLQWVYMISWEQKAGCSRKIVLFDNKLQPIPRAKRSDVLITFRVYSHSCWLGI